MERSDLAYAGGPMDQDTLPAGASALTSRRSIAQRQHSNCPGNNQPTLSLGADNSEGREARNQSSGKGYFFLPFLRAAQYFLILSETAFRASELIVFRLRRFAGLLAAALPEPGGRPLRRVPICRASIARFKRSRSSINSARTSGITPMVT